jgi:hypothetical protein
LLLVCGGKETEPRYLDGLKQAFRNPAVCVRIAAKGVDPVSLVKYAATIRDQYRDEFDEVWCVFDVDEFDVTTAIRQADGDDIRLAISNPCFEIWLLLHFADCTASVRDFDDAQRRLKRYVPDYSKSELRFEKFGSGVADATGRARVLEHLGNPSSGVWMVAGTIVGD